jgi:hypothetical protein
MIAGMAAAATNGVLRPGSALARVVASSSSPLLAGLPLVSSGLQAGPGQPPIVARRAWALGAARPAVAPEYGAVKLAFVHHTENPDGYNAGAVTAMLRSIFAFHRYTHGWNDIGYNFVIDRFGRIFEARAGGIDEPVIGAQAGGYNAYSTGIAILGTYSAKRISPAALSALEQLLAWKLSLHGAPAGGRVTVRVTPGGAVYSRYPANSSVSLPRIAGHRDGDSTDCPGDALYSELPGTRLRVAQLAGTPARVTLNLRAGEASGLQNALAGSLTLLEGAPLAGAPIEIQQRAVSHRGETVTEHTITQTTTGPDGQWSLPIAAISSAGEKAALRAICPGAPNLPAAVSDPLTLPGKVSLGATTPSPAPGQVSPPTAPTGAPASG